MISPYFLEGLSKHITKVQKEELETIFLRLKNDYASLYSVFETLESFIFVLNQDFSPLFMNSKARQFFFLEEEEFFQPLFDLIPYHPLFNKLKEYASSSKKMIEEEVMIQGFSPKIWNIKFYHLLDTENKKRDKEHAVYLFIIEDETEKKQKVEKKQLKKSLLSMEYLAAGLAHEIKNPLASIKLYLSLLQRYTLSLPEDLNKEEILHSLVVVEEEVSRINTLTSDFLTNIRPLSLDLQKINLKELLEQSLEILYIDMREQKIELLIKEQEDLPLILGDPQYLKIVVLNIIKNALESFEGQVRERKMITITLQENNPFVEMMIKDNGKGMTQKELAEIFEPYFTTKKNGSGVGLTFVHKIISEHKGTIDIHSAKDKGTQCVISLPVYGGGVRRFLENKKEKKNP